MNAFSVDYQNLSQAACLAVCNKTVKAFPGLVLMQSVKIKSCFRLHVKKVISVIEL